MNKKLKLSLLGVLFAGSALAITLPIVSCSGSNATTTTLTVTKDTGTDNANVTALATAVAGLASLNGNANTVVSAANLATITGTTNGYTGAVKTAVDALFVFKNGSTDVADADAIESVSFSGTLPTEPSTAVNVTVTVKLKSAYTATAADLTQEVRIGQTAAAATALTVATGNATQLAAIGTEIAKLGLSSATNNTGNLSETEFNTARDGAKYTVAAVKTAIDAYFTFTDNGTAVGDATAIAGITVTGTWPTAAGAANVQVVVNLNTGYTATTATASLLTFSVQIGARA